MANRKEDIWVEKYRPTSLVDLALSTSNRKFLNDCLSKGSVPHLLLSGPPGIGKTTLAQIIVNSLDCRALVLNASNDRGIDTVRDCIGNFVRSRLGSSWNIVVLDESDALTVDAQNSLRNMMEEYVEQSRFVMTANYPQRIIKPLKSRCIEITLSDIKPKDRAIILHNILKKEKVKYDKKTLEQYALYYTDLRKLIHAAQQSSIEHNKLVFVTNTQAAGKDVWTNVVNKNWRVLVDISKDPTTDHSELLKDLFWVIPDNAKPHPAKLRSIVEEKLTSLSMSPDPVITFLGCCALLIKEDSHE